jgi:ABC-type multidrug transport system fused ATPase/permease subunit
LHVIVLNDCIFYRSQSFVQIADIFIYSFLAWYFSQVWPSKVGVPKPFYFLLLPGYWFPKADMTVSHPAQTLNAGLMSPEGQLGIEDGVTNGGIPTEAVNENLLGEPTVVIKGLRKGYNGVLAVNDLSFNMYENQIFALLGHNGAGKVCLH